MIIVFVLIQQSALYFINIVHIEFVVLNMDRATEIDPSVLVNLPY